MANVYDLKPATITITNNAVDKMVELDAGAFNSQKVVDEKDNTIKKLVSGARTIQLFRINSFITLLPGDSVSLTTLSAPELAYYKSLADDEIGVEEAAESEEDTTEESGETTGTETTVEPGETTGTEGN